LLVAGAALLMAACLSAPRRPIVTAPAVPGSDLPPGKGRTILQASCTVCHDLGEVTKFRGYYNRQQWQDIVATMMGYGANISKEDADVLADYLTQSIGRK
jgi:cytochrome c5